VVGFTGIPIVGGKKYPSYYCEKTFHVQCGDCECVDAVPPIYGDASVIHQQGSGDNDVDLYVGSSLACGPFSWSVSGTGFHFGSVAGPTTGETEEEMEIITLYADATACGTATITVTDSCGESSTAYIRCEEDSDWCQTTAQTCSDGTCTCPYPGAADVTVEYLANKWRSDRIVGNEMSRQLTWYACSSAIYPCDNSWWDTHCIPTDPGQQEPCITEDSEFVVPCVNSGGGADLYYRMYMRHYEWRCTVDCP